MVTRLALKKKEVMGSSYLDESHVSPLQRLEHTLACIDAEKSNLPKPRAPWDVELAKVSVDREQLEPRSNHSDRSLCAAPSSTLMAEGPSASEPVRRRYRSYKSDPKLAALHAGSHLLIAPLKLQEAGPSAAIGAVKEKSWPVGREKIPAQPPVGAAFQWAMTDRAEKEAAVGSLLALAGVAASVIQDEQRVATVVQCCFELAKLKSLGEIVSNEAVTVCRYELGKLFQTSGGRVADAVAIARTVETMLAAPSVQELQMAQLQVQELLQRISAEQKVRERNG